MADWWPVKCACDLTPLVNTSCKGVSNLCDLLFGRFKSNEERHAVLAAAQTKVDAQKIENGELVYEGGKLIPALGSIPPLYALGMQQEVDNLSGNLNIAIGILKDTADEDISDESVDPDWFARWRQGATVIGNTEMQALWGRILAEEVKKPGHFSYRTLDILKNTSREDAERFMKVFNTQVGGVLPCKKGMNFFGMEYYDTVRLIESGLINPNKTLALGMEQDDGSYAFLGQGFVFIVRFSEHGPGSGIGGLSISNAGMEIGEAADIEEISKEKMQYVFDCFRLNPRNKFNQISVHKLIDDTRYVPDPIETFKL